MADLRSELRAATSASHIEIEKNPRLSKLLSGTLDFDSYIDVLARYYGFFKPMENALAPHISEADLKTPALAADLHDFDLSKTPLAADLPSLSSRGSIFGALYVLEGSAMGGVQIAKHLAQFPFTEGRRSFFVSDGAAVSFRWKSFLARLAELSESEWPDACTSAVRTFSFLDTWMAGS